MSLPDLTLFNFPFHPEQLSPAVDPPPAHLPPAQATKLQVRAGDRASAARRRTAAPADQKDPADAAVAFLSRGQPSA